VIVGIVPISATLQPGALGKHLFLLIDYIQEQVLMDTLICRPWSNAWMIEEWMIDK